MRKLLALLLLPFAAGAADVSVTWTQPTQNTDGSAIPASGAGSIASNRVEWGTCAGTAFGVKAGEKTATGASTVVPNLAPGTWCFRVYATNTYGNESLASAATSKVIAAPTPNPPTIVTVTTVARLYLRDNVSLVAGTVPLGTECGEQVKGDWYEVDRSTVRLNLVGKLARNAKLVSRCAASG